MRQHLLSVGGLIVAAVVGLQAQWFNYPDPRIPRLPSSIGNLSKNSPACRASVCKRQASRTEPVTHWKDKLYGRTYKLEINLGEDFVLLNLQATNMCVKAPQEAHGCSVCDQQTIFLRQEEF